jgi:hypothetical protein
LLALQVPYVAIDRTFCFASSSRLTMQIVPKWIYEASYPAWFLNKAELVQLLTENYRVLSIFDALGGKIKVGSCRAEEIGFLCQLKG